LDRYQSTKLLSASKLAAEKNDRWLFQDISFALEPGELLHIKGSNGSGKTTLLRILCGLTRADDGEVFWGGEKILRKHDEYHSQLSYVGHHDGIKQDLTVEENLKIANVLAQDKRHSKRKIDLDEVLEQVGLRKKKYSFARTLSAGQKRRLALSRCLLNDTAVWILDEPLTSLDTHGIEFIESMIKQHLAKDGLALVTSHHALNVKTNNYKELHLS